MRKTLMPALGALALFTAAAPAFAYSHIYPTEAGAQATCPANEVVWLDLNRQVYFHKASAEFGKSGGAFACVSAARDRGYREAKIPVQEAAKQ